MGLIFSIAASDALLCHHLMLMQHVCCGICERIMNGFLFMLDLLKLSYAITVADC